MTRERLAFAFGLVSGWFAHDSVQFARIDSCLDDGGTWNYQHETCTIP